MITRSELITYLDDLLQSHRFQDYCPNGLQVAGSSTIARIVTGVTASQALIDAAIAAKADTILVHHGYFWRNESPVITGIKQQRLKKLLAHDINLIAYHLPLDAHETLGNNQQLANVLGITVDGEIPNTGQPALGLYGQLSQPTSVAEFSERLSQCLNRQPLAIIGHDGPVNRIGWCTGGAQHYIQQAYDMGLDSFISGEISESTVHLAREAGIHYFAAGHHATERYGVKALGDYLASQFALSVQFIDIDNPV